MIAHHLEGLLPIQRALELEAGRLQERGCHLGVQLVVLCQQSALAAEIDLGHVELLLNVLLRRLGPQQLNEQLLQARLEQRLAHEEARARLARFLLDLGPIVSRDHDDRHVFVRPLANLADRLHAIHARHDPVDDHGKELLARRLGIHKPIHRFAPRQHVFRLHAQILEHDMRRFTHHLVVIHDEHGQVDELFVHALVQLGDLQEHRGGERGPFAQLTLHLNVAIHHARRRKRDRQPKPRALLLHDLLALSARERVEHMRQVILAHADTVVLHGEVELRDLRAARVLLFQCDIDRAALGRVLDRVAHQVGVDLLQAHVVTDHFFVNDILHANDHLLLLRVGLRPVDVNQIIQHHGKIERLLGKLDAPRFDL